MMTLWVCNPYATRLATALLLLAGLQLAHGQEAQQFVPAQFRQDEFSLVDNISFPEGDSDEVVIIHCVAAVDRRGRLKYDNFYCLDGNEKTLEYESRVLRAMQQSRMTPASVNGRKTEVSMPLTVLFHRKDGQQEILAAPNHLLNEEAFGMNYISPQLIHRTRKNIPPCTNLILKMKVDTAGQPFDAAFHRGNATERCTAVALNWVENWRFIPGFVNGEPREMNHLLTVSWRTSNLRDGNTEGKASSRGIFK